MDAKKYRYYIIDMNIVFDSQDHTLSDMESNNTFKLLTPSSLCLSYLLQHQGEIISRYKLMEAGWENHGLSATMSTLNQNILLIRKCFANLTQVKIIKTVFRQGVMIPTDIQVWGVNNIQKNETISVESDSDLSSQAQPYENKTELDCENVKIKRKYSIDFGSVIIFFFVILAPLIMMSAGNDIIDYFFNELPDESYFYQSKENFSIEKCKIFHNKDVNDFKLLRLILGKEKDYCKTERYVYYAYLPNINRVSIITCGNNINAKSVNCHSYYSFN